MLSSRGPVSRYLSTSFLVAAWLLVPRVGASAGDEVDWGPFEQPAAEARKLMDAGKWSDAGAIYGLVAESEDPR
jgi:hypothetical protein